MFFFCPTDLPVGEGVPLDVGPSLLFQVPSNPRGMDPIPLPLFFFSSFFCPTWSSRIFFVLSSVQGLWLMFSWFSVRTFPSVDIFLMHLWRDETWCPPTPLPSFLLPPPICYFLFYLYCLGRLKVKVKLLSSVWLFVAPGTVAYVAPPSMT